MKITLNTSIAPTLRNEAETLVRSRFPKAEVLWESSRFPRYVILVEPSPGDVPDRTNTSIFDSKPTGSSSEVTSVLEQTLRQWLEKK